MKEAIWNRKITPVMNRDDRAYRLSHSYYILVKPYYNALYTDSKKRLQHIAKRAKVDSNVEESVQRGQDLYTTELLKDEKHPLSEYFRVARSGRRYFLPKRRTER